MAGRSSISERELHTMMGIVAGADDGGAGDPLPYSILHGLHELIPCDNVSFIRQDSARRIAEFDQEVGDPGVKGAALEAWLAAYWTHYWQTPFCNSPELTGDLRPVRAISDFHSDREFHNTPMYADCFRVEGTERSMYVCLPSPPGRALRVIFFRGRDADFSDRDRGLLALLRPHLYEAYRRQRQRERTPPPLTPREWQVLRLVGAGYTNGQIGRRLSISEGTVRKHLEHVFERLGVGSRTAAVARSLEWGPASADSELP